MTVYCDKTSLIFLYISIILVIIVFLIKINNKNAQKIQNYRKYKKIFSQYSYKFSINQNFFYFLIFFNKKMRTNYNENLKKKDFILINEFKLWEKNFYKELLHFQFLYSKNKIKF